EYMCSFDAAFRGSYYGKQINELQDRSTLPTDKEIGTGITVVPYDPSEVVNVAMDVGRADATAIWFWQTVNGRFRVIDYFEASELDALETVEGLELKPYRYENIWLPHDAFHETWASRKSGFDTFYEAFGDRVKRVPNPDKGNKIKHGIDAV